MTNEEKLIFEERVKQVKLFLMTHLDEGNSTDLSKEIIRGAEGGGEIIDFQNWFENRFKEQLVWLDKDDYARAITRALPQAMKFARADFGGTRQRDLGQLWTDTARGFLGEIAFKKFLDQKFSIIIEQDISRNESLDTYISNDIKSVNGRSPKLNVSIKTGKFNARWMDEYSAKKNEKIGSFIFVRAGTVKEHFVSFLKSIGFLQNQLFPIAEMLGELTKSSSLELLNEIPDFRPIPAYISGYLLNEEDQNEIKNLSFTFKGSANYRGKGKDTRKIEIKTGVGVFNIENLFKNKQISEINSNRGIKMIVSGIEKEVDDTDHFYANTGSFNFGINKWKIFINKL